MNETYSFQSVLHAVTRVPPVGRVVRPRGCPQRGHRLLQRNGPVDHVRPALAVHHARRAQRPVRGQLRRILFECAVAEDEMDKWRARGLVLKAYSTSRKSAPHDAHALIFLNASQQLPCVSRGDAMLPASFGALSLDVPPLFLDLLALPRPLMIAIFALLPVDTRLFCSEVNRAWRALLADSTLFACLDLSTSSGLKYFSWPLLRAAVAKAGGQLRTLDLTGQLVVGDTDLCRLREVVAANAATLTELLLDKSQGDFTVEQVLALLDAAPTLTLLDIQSVDIRENHQVARAMLRNKAPFQGLRLRRLRMSDGLNSPAKVATFCSNLRRHASIEQLNLGSAVLDTSDAMGSVVDACIALRVRYLDLYWCRVAPTLLPELTRLIEAGALRELIVQSSEFYAMDVFDESTLHFVAAVRASAMTRLYFNTRRVPADVASAVAFINARSQ